MAGPKQDKQCWPLSLCLAQTRLHVDVLYASCVSRGQTPGPSGGQADGRFKGLEGSRVPQPRCFAGRLWWVLAIACTHPRGPCAGCTMHKASTSRYATLCTTVSKKQYTRRDDNNNVHTVRAHQTKRPKPCARSAYRPGPRGPKRHKSKHAARRRVLHAQAGVFSVKPLRGEGTLGGG